MKIIPVQYKTPLQTIKAEEIKPPRPPRGKRSQWKKTKGPAYNNTGYRKLENSKKGMGDAIQIRSDNEMLPITISEARYQQIMKRSEAFGELK